MTKSLTRLISASAVATLFSAPASAAPTCSQFGFTTHGQHVVSQYILNLPLSPVFSLVAWPPKGFSAAGGAIVPGGSGAHGHLLVGLPPGASFCTGAPGQAR
ncbi:MAG TPA: hypothetical protein VNT60_03755 [Deinococcales bacterium]|nr:hypothetical protein [Deinococcales bacterium]